MTRADLKTGESHANEGSEQRILFREDCRARKPLRSQRNPRRCEVHAEPASVEAGKRAWRATDQAHDSHASSYGHRRTLLRTVPRNPQRNGAGVEHDRRRADIAKRKTPNIEPAELCTGDPRAGTDSLHEGISKR